MFHSVLVLNARRKKSTDFGFLVVSLPELQQQPSLAIEVEGLYFLALALYQIARLVVSAGVGATGMNTNVIVSTCLPCTDQASVWTRLQYSRN